MIKKLLTGAMVLFAITSLGQSVCSDPQGVLTPDITPQTINSTGGFYEFFATSGCNYSFSHCSNGGSYTGDTYLRITDLTNATTYATNDDNCGLGSELTWTATVTGIVRLHLGVCCGTNLGTCGGGPTRVLAYWSSCAPCISAPLTIDAVTPVCMSGEFDLTGTSTDVISWFSSSNTSATPLFTGTPFNTGIIASTTQYYAASYDAVNGCFGYPQAVVAEVHNPLTIDYDGDTVFCDNGEATSMAFTPGGGTISGTGVVGNMFDPVVAGPGIYWIYYDAGDACVSTDSVEVEVNAGIIDPAIYACEGDLIPVSGTGPGTLAWYGGQLSNVLLDTGATIMWPLDASTTLYYGELPPDFSTDTVLVANYLVSEHNTQTGDDRAGIAITPDYFYVVGDNNTGRINADLSGSWTSLPIRDGIFSDLSTGSLYTLWNGTAAPLGTYIGTDYNLNAICPMDADLNINTSAAIALSQTIVLNNVSGDIGVFAGQGYVAIWTPQNNTFYQIEIGTGTVTTLGTGTINAYNGENWAFWGNYEIVGGESTVTYRNNAGSYISRYNITTPATTTIANFPGGLSDMCSITTSPWHNRLYFHYEGSTTTFGGSSETGGYTDALLAYDGGSTTCRTAVSLFISEPQPVLAADTTICSNAPLVLNPGSGFGSYSWSTSASTPTIAVSTAGEYSVEVTDSLGCTNSDTINVAVNNVMNVNLGSDITLCDYQIVVLNAGGGYTDYDWSNGQSGQIIYVETDTLSIGPNTFTVITTDVNGCFTTDNIDIIVMSCLGVEEENGVSFNVYPNPVSSTLFIDLNGYAAKSIQLVDLSGKFVTSVIPVSNIATLDVSEIADGLYLIQVLGFENEIQKTVKITVSH